VASILPIARGGNLHAEIAAHWQGLDLEAALRIRTYFGSKHRRHAIRLEHGPDLGFGDGRAVRVDDSSRRGPTWFEFHFGVVDAFVQVDRHGQIARWIASDDRALGVLHPAESVGIRG